jgi:hypothetical protein
MFMLERRSMAHWRIAALIIVNLSDRPGTSTARRKNGRRLIAVND